MGPPAKSYHLSSVLGHRGRFIAKPSLFPVGQAGLPPGEI